MLLIHNGQTKAVELDALTDEGMRSHYDVDASISYTRSDLWKAYAADSGGQPGMACLCLSYDVIQIVLIVHECSKPYAV